MRIALVSLQFEETATGGGGVHVKNMYDQFLKMGHIVTVISIHKEKIVHKVQLQKWTWEGIAKQSLEFFQR